MMIASKSGSAPARVFEGSWDDWSGISDPQRRKRLQNRLNQRAYRDRRRRARMEMLLGADASTEQPSSLSIPAPVNSLNCSPSLLDPLDRDIVFFARDKLWPSFHPSLFSPDPRVVESLSDVWIRRILAVPLMRHSIVAATSWDLQYLTGRDYSATYLRSVNELIREVRLLVQKLHVNPDSGGDPAVGDARPRLDDDLLFAVMSLAKANSSPEADAVRRPGHRSRSEIFGLFSPPLQTLQSIHLWGQQSSRGVHFSALVDLVRLKGGLSSVTTPGFAEALHLFDVYEAAKTLHTPSFEIPLWYVRFLGRVRRLERDMTTTGVERFLALGLRPESPLLDVLRDIRIYCHLISFITSADHRTTQEHDNPWGFPSTCELTTLRNLIEYQLLAHQAADSVEEICRSAALIFTHGCIFPLPMRAPIRRLVASLVNSLRRIQKNNAPLGRDKGFLAWVSMMGALAADEDDREFFTSQLRTYAAKLRISSWLMFKKTVLCQYLWLDEACEAGGMEVWSMVTHENPSLSLSTRLLEVEACS